MPPQRVWTAEDDQSLSQDSMPVGCATELRASEKHSTIGLLTRDAYDVSTIAKEQEFSTLDHLVGVVTQVLRFCYKPDSPLHSMETRERELERLLIKSVKNA